MRRADARSSPGQQLSLRSACLPDSSSFAHTSFLLLLLAPAAAPLSLLLARSLLLAPLLLSRPLQRLFLLLLLLLTWPLTQPPRRHHIICSVQRRGARTHTTGRRHRRVSLSRRSSCAPPARRRLLDLSSSASFCFTTVPLLRPPLFPLSRLRPPSSHPSASVRSSAHAPASPRARGTLWRNNLRLVASTTSGRGGRHNHEAARADEARGDFHSVSLERQRQRPHLRREGRRGGRREATARQAILSGRCAQTTTEEESYGRRHGSKDNKEKRALCGRE